MSRSILLLFIFGLVTATNAPAAKFLITGQAAGTLFVCQFFPIYFDCWYSKPYSYCEIETDDPIEVVEDSNAKTLIVSGLTATKVSWITSDCHDGDLPGYRYFYGDKGVKCERDIKGVVCSLAIDSIQP